MITRHEGGSPMGETINLTAEDGHKLAAYKATPSGKPRGALVVIQEIFGVNHHIKNVTDGFAKDGYLSIAKPSVTFLMWWFTPKISWITTSAPHGLPDGV